MKTARERHEKKTKVVTFRVANEIYDQIEDIKAKNGLSNADLMKLGARIAQEEIKAKLAEIIYHCLKVGEPYQYQQKYRTTEISSDK